MAILNEDDETLDSDIDEATGEVEDEGTIDYKAKYEAEVAARETVEHKNKQLFERAKKAEVAKKSGTTGGTTANETKGDDLSQSEMFTLMKSGVDEDDVDEVKAFARYRGITVKEALANSTLKAVIAERVSERATADVTSTKNVGGTTTKLDGNALLAKARAGGETSDSDDAIDAMVNARIQQRMRKQQ